LRVRVEELRGQDRFSARLRRIVSLFDEIERKIWPASAIPQLNSRKSDGLLERLFPKIRRSRRSKSCSGGASGRSSTGRNGPSSWPWYKALPLARHGAWPDRLEIHYTPKHASWLDVAEIELSVFTKHCLNRRIADIATLRVEATAWYERRNTEQVGVDWQFTTDDARTKLKRLYPQVKVK